ncbi:MAG: GDP-fucose protein O-fucosyltransferase-domain-containing protein [Linnemannia gamsii]|nr:MAG: GDP-fucose protein O-fucosyltransferase-domain-containing protein [Linnemannia gamsii]
MPGPRTRRLLSLGAIVISGVILLHLFSSRNPLDVDLRLADITSQHLPPYHPQQHQQQQEEQPSSMAQHPSIPEPMTDAENVLRPTEDRSIARQDDARRPKEAPLPDDIPKPRTTLDSDTKYLGYLMYGGLTNQFIAFENAAFVALKLNRTLILPPFITTNHDKDVTNQRWSEFFDLNRFTALSGIKTVEWHDIRPLSPEHVQIGNKQVRSHGRNNPWWPKLAENLTCHVTFGFGDAEDIHTTERNFLRQFLLKPRYVRPPLARRAAIEGEGDGDEEYEDEVGEGGDMDDRNQNGTPSGDAISKKDNSKDDIFYLDQAVERFTGYKGQTVFLSHTYKLKDPNGPRSWKEAGQYMHFNAKVKDYALRIIRHRTPEFKETGKYIAMHLRRGDIWMKCRTKSAEQMMDCIPPLGHYAEMVDQAMNIEGKRLPVLVTTDSDSEEDFSTMARLGWRRLNHDLYTTEQELGIFGPAMVDAAILADADFLVGTKVSTMTRIAARRQVTWHGHEPLYPRTTTSWTPEN